MKDYLKTIYKIILEKYADLYLYYWKGIEDGPRIEKRMLRFQHKVERMMKRQGIALVAMKTSDGGITMSYVPEEQWDAQQEKVQQEIMDEMMKPIGDSLSEKTLEPIKELTIDEEVKKLLED